MLSPFPALGVVISEGNVLIVLDDGLNDFLPLLLYGDLRSPLPALGVVTSEGKVLIILDVSKLLIVGVVTSEGNVLMTGLDALVPEAVVLGVDGVASEVL